MAGSEIGGRVEISGGRPVYCALILLAGLWVLGCDTPHPPNVILISVDTLRADHLSCYGYAKPTSPHIDAFADDALLFENAISHGSVTIPTVASILTGFLPHETKAIEVQGLLQDLETLPEMLQRHGYTTMAVVSNFSLLAKRGFSQGFSIYDETMVNRQQVLSLPERIAKHTTDRAIELLGQQAREPFFMWIHYQDPHATYTPPARYAELFRDPERAPRLLKANETMSGRGGIPIHQLLGSNRDYHHYVAQYDGEIRYLDQHFGRLIDALQRLQLYDDALIIFTADHGENMGEHDYFFNHGENLYHGVTHVPLMVRYGEEPRGKRTEFVQHVDIVPTVMNAVDASSDSAFRGHDLLQQLPPRREIFAESEVWWSGENRVYFVVRDGMKLIYRPSLDLFHLFDLNTDPGEERDLIRDDRYRTQKLDLTGIVARIRDENRLNLGPVGKPVELTEEEKEKLKSLGYVR